MSLTKKYWGYDCWPGGFTVKELPKNIHVKDHKPDKPGYASFGPLTVGGLYWSDRYSIEYRPMYGYDYIMKVALNQGKEAARIYYESDRLNADQHRHTEWKED